MTDNSICYITGEEIHLGDKVRHYGTLWTVVLVIGRDEWQEDFKSQKDWHKEEFGSGFMIESDKNDSVMYPEADEDIELVCRAEKKQNK